MDPQQRLLMEVTEEALTTARLSVLGAVAGKCRDGCVCWADGMPLLLRLVCLSPLLFTCHTSDQNNCPCAHAVGEGVGVFVGISTPDYSTLAQAAAEISAYSATGSALSVAAGRLSYAYGFKGPSVAVDTACSSSLVGTHMARLSMETGGCNTASTGKWWKGRAWGRVK